MLFRLWLVVAASAFAADNATVSGTVVNDLSGAPLHMAYVMLATAGAKPLEAAVYTDAHGAFSFAAPPGRYYLHAAESGYTDAWFGAPTPDHSPAIMTLHAGEARQGIEFRLRPFGVISGRVLDQDNDPVPFANVELVVPAVRRGKRTYETRNIRNTNDRGEFRVSAYRPGRYYLRVSAPNGDVPAAQPQVALGDAPAALVYVPSFYPGVSRLAEATAVDVRAGVEVRDITARISAQPVATVTGKVILPEGLSSAAGITVYFQSVDGIDSPGTFTGFGVAEDGNIYGARLTPGRYRAITQLNGETEYRGVEEVEIRPGPQELTLHLVKGVPIAGRLTLQGPNAGDLTKERVTLANPDNSVPQVTANVKADGTFEFPNVVAGVWDIGVQPIPKGGFVKSMKIGRQDVLTEEMVIGQETRESLNIVVSSRGGVITGAVTRPPDEMAELVGRARARILLAPTGRFADVESLFGFTAADEKGSYEFRGITPGPYKLFALDRIEPGAWQDPDFMKRIDDLGQRIDIREGDQLKIDLEVKTLPPGVSK